MKATSENDTWKKWGDKVQLLVEKAQTVEHHGFDRMASGHSPHGRVLLRRVINDLSNAEFFKHPRDQTHVIQDLRMVRLRLWRELRAVRWSHSLLLYRGECIDTQKLLNDTYVVRNVGNTPGKGI
jgi:hypothetical protein